MGGLQLVSTIFFTASFSTKYMRGSRKLLSEGVNFDNVFLVDKGREDQKSTISGPSLTRQRNAI